MSKANTFETELLLHIFNNVDIANIGDVTGVRGSTVAGSLYLALHSADPGEANKQDSNEISYTGYARVAVARASGAGGFTVSTNQVTLATNMSFGTRTDSGAAIEATFFSIGVNGTAAAATNMLYYGALVGANLAYEFTGLDVGNTIKVPGSAYVIDDRVVFFPGAESTLPGGLSDGQILYIKSVSGTTYTLSATSTAGLNTEYNLSADGAGIVQKISTITIAQNTTPQLTTGTKIIED